jgi:hypothetical protein
MAINTLSKNTIGVVLALLLVILLSESRLFKLLTDTYLGRAFLIIIILFASYLNKILGVVSVFIIVIMFNNFGNNSFYEGIDGTVTTNNTNNKTTKPPKDSTDDDKNGKQNTSTTSESINTHTSVPNDKVTVTTSSSTSSTEKAGFRSIEGFDLQSTENNIKRGKQSNSIPINQYNNQSIEVAPYEGPSFSNLFGFFK